MPTSSHDLAVALGALGDAAAVSAEILPGPAGTVARVVGVAVRFAAALARQGLDPVAHLERIRDGYGPLHDAERAFTRALDAQFGIPRPPSEAPTELAPGVAHAPPSVRPLPLDVDPDDEDEEP